LIRLTRRYRFSASHRLHSPALSGRDNAELYGRCNNPHGHGHSYVLDVSLSGPVDESTGRVADLAALDRLVETRILSRLGHRDLAAEAPDIAGSIPTSENLAAGIRASLQAHWHESFPGREPRLDRVRLYETPRNVFDELVLR
jgi:6-pyruvoyltetrahydropterin/6-carboxytetrahydropterin synthase